MPSASYPPGMVAEVVPADDARDPERWLVALCWALIVYCLAQILLMGFGRDQAAHDLVGEAILRGQMPYRDAWDPSAPGIFFVHALVLALLGKSMLALRLLEVAGALWTVLCLRWLGGTLFGSRTAGLFGAALATLLHAQLDFYSTGQPETFAGFLTAGALVVTVRASRRPVAQAAGLGLLAGSVLLLVPALAAFVVVCAAYLGRRLLMTRGAPALLAPSLVLVACTALPITLTLGWFQAEGATSDLWWTLGTFASRTAEATWAGRTSPELFYDASVELFVGLSALLPVGVLAMLTLPVLYAREREGLFLLLGILSVQIATIAITGYREPHHYGASLPLLALVSGVGFYKIWQRLAATGVAGALALISILIVVGSMREPARDLPQGFWKRSALRMGYMLRVGPLSTREELDRALGVRGDYSFTAVRNVTQELGHRLSPDDTVYVGLDEPLVYWLSSAEPAHRFLRGNPNGPDGRGFSEALERDLKKRPPTYLVLDEPLPHSFERHYRKVEVTRRDEPLGRFSLYERSPYSGSQLY